MTTTPTSGRSDARSFEDRTGVVLLVHRWTVDGMVLTTIRGLPPEVDAFEAVHLAMYPTEGYGTQVLESAVDAVGVKTTVVQMRRMN